MKDLLLFKSNEQLKMDEQFLNNILVIPTDQTSLIISSVFKACLENTLPYLEIILESPYLSPRSLKKSPTLSPDSEKILMVNCYLSALQTFLYLQQKDSYSNLKESIEKFFNDKMDLDSNAKDLYNRLLIKASKNSYLNQFMLYRNNNGVPQIGTYCQELTLELFLNNQRYLESETIEASKKTTLFNKHYVFNLQESISQLEKFSRFPSNSANYKKLKTTVHKFLHGLTRVEEHWKPLDRNSNFNLHANEWIYYYNRELIFHSRAILSFLFNSIIDNKFVHFDDEFEPWNDYFLTFVSIPLTYNLSTLIKNNPSILKHEYTKVNAAFSILLKAFAISLFNSCGEDIDKCCKKLFQQLYNIEQQEKLFTELSFKEGSSRKNIKKDITAGLPIFEGMDYANLFDFRNCLLILYSTMPKLYFNPNYNFMQKSIWMNTKYGPAPLPKEDLFKKELLDAKDAKDENRLKSFQKILGQEYYYFLHQKAAFEVANVLKSK